MCAAGCGDITAVHLLHGKSDLCRHLSVAFSAILTYYIVPVVLHTGIIFSLLKKQTLNLNNTGSYRPVTLNSTFFTKFLELYM